MIFGKITRKRIVIWYLLYLKCVFVVLVNQKSQKNQKNNGWTNYVKNPSRFNVAIVTFQVSTVEL